MPRAPRGSAASPRPRAGAGTPRETARSRTTEAPPRTVGTRRREIPTQPPALEEHAGREEAAVIEPLADIEQSTRPATAGPRFQIFVIDAGWDSPAHRVLRQNFGLLHDLQKGERIYVLSREKSIEFIRQVEESQRLTVFLIGLRESLHNTTVGLGLGAADAALVVLGLYRHAAPQT